MKTEKYFDHTTGMIVAILDDAVLTSGASKQITLPESNGDALSVTVIGADGTVLVSGAATYTAKITGKVFKDHNTPIVPGYVTVTAGTGGLAQGSKIVVQFVL